MGLGKATLSFTVLRAQDLPEAQFPRWAVLGRSNVGKSSLLNALLHPFKMFRTGSTPGLTQGLIGVQVRLGQSEKTTLEIVDVPGFGFALNPKRRDWEKLGISLMEKANDQPLMWLWLVEASREPDELDREVAKWLGTQLFKIVFTKADRISKNKRQSLEKKWQDFVQRSAEASVWASAKSGEGIESLAKSARNYLLPQ